MKDKKQIMIKIKLDDKLLNIQTDTKCYINYIIKSSGIKLPKKYRIVIHTS